ncbi:hypothetical protein PSm6_49970 [Pseudomonas solani]|uniref:I78 family peptidase inhibitor n=1 Tax=Pseudomonas solani TaxID=2731552 RepID=A0AAU7XUS5_9PSED|nr:MULTISPECIES: I78 family peptidase inhibitor [Pseudomonas]EQM71436.1 hypothetical protein L682_05885 [Pseudomonas alcaligenes OT 69]MBB4819218.1 ABC-type antimicrobial peptide transport system permease subunit [Pseudomonas alcaligenes]MDN4145120.1 I78 family peptidase inhibitor [Pseudomonas tohonis]MCU9951497.1 I78 family peptidase inhibitor [Pseudomonas sp. PDM13]MDU9413214.1 I78 family peptidase inhibitor [Pseudomonas sp. zfem005]
MSRTSITLGLALVGALLAGCSSTDAPAEKPAAAATESLPAAAPSEDGRCSSGPVRSLIGKAATPELVEQAKNAAGASDVRVLKPGSVMTLEYNSRRLNIDTDDTNLIKGVSCG